MAADVARKKKHVTTWQRVDTPDGRVYMYTCVCARMCVHLCKHVCVRVRACEERDKLPFQITLSLS